YLGLGEVMVFIFFGLVAVMGTTFVQTRSVSLASLYAAIGIGALACAILVANNLRDIPTDIQAGKRTLAVVLGDQRTRYFFVLLLGLAVVALVGVALVTSELVLLTLALVAIPMAATTRTVLSGAGGPGLIPVLKQTGTIELLYGLGILIGCSLSHWPLG
ncbi:MAG TPA: 1,4-dihydroxy-2-naphthoate octaprenyltransferase, partial [Marmoricola sp.]|nr:1,4-dihydroxy-2-naphthoate octaprenyltransferase [Marmoricola sp.]